MQKDIRGDKEIDGKGKHESWTNIAVLTAEADLLSTKKKGGGEWEKKEKKKALNLWQSLSQAASFSTEQAPKSSFLDSDQVRTPTLQGYKMQLPVVHFRIIPYRTQQSLTSWEEYSHAVHFVITFSASINLSP